MEQDISDILRNWSYDPERNVRKIWGEDGREKVQIRIQQGGFAGILQMDLDGRPDGRMPYGRKFALDYFAEAQKTCTHTQGEDEPFSLDREACQELFEEGACVYSRYVFLLQVGEYKRVIRDTERNMRLFRFVNTHASHAEDRIYLERWWPYIIRIHALARALLALQNQAYDEALHIVDDARQRIACLEELDVEEFRAERERSEASLGQLEERIRKQMPLSPEEELERQLAELVERESYEEAALVRDRLRALRGSR